MSDASKIITEVFGTHNILDTVKRDIVASARDYADGLRNHRRGTEDAVEDIKYLVTVNGSRRVRWLRVDGKPGFMPVAARFKTRSEALDFIAEHGVEHRAIIPMDQVLYELATSTTYDISKAIDGYNGGKLCPVCNSNAAVKQVSTNNTDSKQGIDEWGSCRICNTGEDPLDVTDYMSCESALSLAQELEAAPPITRTEKKATSRVAKECGGYSRFGSKIV